MQLLAGSGRNVLIADVGSRVPEQDDLCAAACATDPRLTAQSRQGCCRWHASLYAA